MFPHPQRFVRLDTTFSALFGRPRRIYLDDVRTVQVALVLQHLDESAPRSILFIEYQGEYLRLQPQDESDNSELVHGAIADRRVDNPWLKVTGSPISRQESDRK